MRRTVLFTSWLLGATMTAHAQEDYVVLNDVPAFSEPLVKARDGNYYSLHGAYARFRVTPAGQYSLLGDVLVSSTAIDGGDGYFYATDNSRVIRSEGGGRPLLVYQLDVSSAQRSVSGGPRC